MLTTYIKGGTPAQIFLERWSAMTRATFVIFWPKLSSFIDWCCYYTQVSYTGSWEPLVTSSFCLETYLQIFYYVNLFSVVRAILDFLFYFNQILTAFNMLIIYPGKYSTSMGPTEQ